VRRPGPWLAIAVVLGIVVRVVLLPTPGYVDDITQFRDWIHQIAASGLDHAYDANLSFGPVMAYLWGLLAALDPALLTATVMKLPATLADFALAASVWFALRSRPGWAAVAASVILLHPAIWFISAWWGQYESIFALLVVVAYVLAIRIGRRSRSWP
jgi:Gpi18-like mannosyltransferase